ncbi:hypothetical protein J3F84DRAFT_326500 [Trichoderma pleuroticola]
MASLRTRICRTGSSGGQRLGRCMEDKLDFLGLISRATLRPFVGKAQVGLGKARTAACVTLRVNASRTLAGWEGFFLACDVRARCLRYSTCTIACMGILGFKGGRAAAEGFDLIRPAAAEMTGWAALIISLRLCFFSFFGLFLPVQGLATMPVRVIGMDLFFQALGHHLCTTVEKGSPESGRLGSFFLLYLSLVCLFSFSYKYFMLPTICRGLI